MRDLIDRASMFDVWRRFIFGESFGDPTADTILQALRTKPDVFFAGSFAEPLSKGDSR